jgi:hypothetical protein
MPLNNKDFNYVSSLKSTNRHVAPLGCILQTSSKPVFVLTPLCWVLMCCRYKLYTRWFDSTGDGSPLVKSRGTYLFAFVVSGITVGLTIYLYNRKRQKEYDKNSEDKVACIRIFNLINGLQYLRYMCIYL